MTVPGVERVELLRVDRERITASPVVDEEVLVPAVLSADIDRAWIQVFNHVRAQSGVPAEAYALIPPRTVLITVGSTTTVRDRVGLLRELLDITNVRITYIRQGRAEAGDARQAAAEARIPGIVRDLDALGL